MRAAMDRVNDEIEELHTQGVVDGWDAILGRIFSKACNTYIRLLNANDSYTITLHGMNDHAPCKDNDRALQQAPGSPTDATWRH